MQGFEVKIIESVRNISVQISDLNAEDINENLPLIGDGSVFDSFALLLLLAELEKTMPADVVANKSLIEWFVIALDEKAPVSLNIQQFSEWVKLEYFEEIK